MIKAFKAFFLGRELREKLLLVVFVAAIAAIWLSSASGRVRRFWVDAQMARSTLATQMAWLNRSDSIEARSKVAIAKLDPIKTYSDTRLLAEINRLASQQFRGGNKVQVTTEASKRAGQIATNSVTTNISAANTEADWQALIKFYLELQKLAPYINLQECTVTSSRTGMNIRLLATSIEVIR